MECRDIIQAFKNAARNGLEDSENYEYMYSIGKNDYFKHMITGKYRCIEIQDFYYPDSNSKEDNLI